MTPEGGRLLIINFEYREMIKAKKKTFMRLRVDEYIKCKPRLEIIGVKEPEDVLSKDYIYLTKIVKLCLLTNRAQI